jgi:hypothetical protein
MEKDDKEIISSMTNEALAANVVAYKSLSLNKEFAKKCLAELVLRKSQGDSFDYEKFINEELEKLPKVKNTDYNGLFSILKNQFKVSK